MKLRFVAFFELDVNQLERFVGKWSDRKAGKGIKILLSPHTLAEPYNRSTGFVVFESDNMGLLKDYLVKFQVDGANIKLFPIWDNSKLSKEITNFRRAEKVAQEKWEQSVFQKIEDIGTTQSLMILPLIDWHTACEELKVETGVSYLIKTDNETILFDLGLNREQSDPSPLLYNMKHLGITLENFDTLVISHNHRDHVGGEKWSKKKTFSLSNVQIDLGSKKVYTPIPMTYPDLNPICLEKPEVISKGVATTGTIANAMFGDRDTQSLIQEQSLVVNVEGKGIVIIVGCGHQTLPKIVERVKSLFHEPIYGIIGGLHLSVEGGPYNIMGMYFHKYFGTGNLPWQPIAMTDLKRVIELLKKQNLKIVSLSPHDSSEVSLQAFQKIFSEAYRKIMVGETIVV